ncbi:MAG: HlyD family efflux transporter periplasmic adaptor subunit [Planctomycetaceae bacterium]
MEERYNDLREQAHALTVTAPVSGVVLDHDLNDLQGAYVSTGRLLVRLGGAAEIEALALVPQFQEEFFRAHIQQRVVFHVDGTGTAWHDSELLDVAPRATREIPHVALAAHTGGSLAVRINNDDDDPSHATARYELVDPHFLARVRLSQSGESGDHATIFAPGQTGTLACLTEDGSVGQHLRRTVIDWWNVRQRAARDQLYRH